MSESKTIKKLDKIETVLYMMVFQLIELNRLIKKLNYISGTSDTISPEEITQEIEFLSKFADCIRKKGIVCPIRGIVRKVIRKEEEADK